MGFNSGFKGLNTVGHSYIVRKWKEILLE